MKPTTSKALYTEVVDGVEWTYWDDGTRTRLLTEDEARERGVRFYEEPERPPSSLVCASCGVLCGHHLACDSPEGKRLRERAACELCAQLPLGEKCIEHRYPNYVASPRRQRCSEELCRCGRSPCVGRESQHAPSPDYSIADDDPDAWYAREVERLKDRAPA